MSPDSESMQLIAGSACVPLWSPASRRQKHRPTALIFIGFNLFYGFASAHTDLTAHIGGLVTGFVTGLPPHNVCPHKGKGHSRSRAPFAQNCLLRTGQGTVITTLPTC